MHYIIISLLFLTTTTYSKALCNQSYNAGKYQQALIACEHEYSISNKPELLVKLIEITHELDLSDKQSYYLARLKDSPQFDKTTEYRYKWNRWQGITSYHKGNINESEKYFLETLSLAIIEKNQQWVAKSYNGLGVIANQRKNFKGALNYYNQSLEIYKKIEDIYSSGIGYINIGTVYQHLEEYQSAIDYYKLALNTFQTYKDKNISNTQTIKDVSDTQVIKNINHTLESLLNINLLIDDFESADIYAQRVLKETAHLTGKEKIASITNFATLYLNKNQNKLAEYFLDKAFDVSQKNGHYFESQIDYTYAKLYQKQNLIDKAITQANNGIDKASKGDFIMLAKLYLFLSELYEESQPIKSLGLLKKHQQTREKLLKQKYDSDIKTIQYQIEKSQIEHELNLTKLERISTDLKIKSLNNRFLIMTIVLIILITGITTFYVAKKREKKFLTDKIEHHKQQLIMLDIKHNEHESDEEHSPTVNKGVFCAALVDTMNEALNIWEKQTKTNRTELADQSGIWTISNDDGTLRTRSLDKYLSVDKIPKNPRWRNVVRTCHFVLANVDLDKSNRELLENKLTNVLSLFQNLTTNLNS